MRCPMCGTPHDASILCHRLRQVALSLNLFAVPAFVTDTVNRFLCVNETFASMIGDPVKDRLSSDMRFIPLAIIGPYRDCFPEGRQDVAQCATGLLGEVEAGRLAPVAARLLEKTLAKDEDLNRLVRRTETPWDGTIVIKDRSGRMSMVREQVVPLADGYGRESTFHISLWLPTDRQPPRVLAETLERPAGVASTLTPRQIEVARWYAAGLTSKNVASQAGISVGTARAHLEEIYSRLDIHSRAELTALLVREGLA